MARIVTVAAARKGAGTCLRCQQPIEAGQGYSHIAFRYGGKRMIHAACGPFRPSETTNNDKLSALYTAQEVLEDSLNTDFIEADDVRGVLGAEAEAIREVAEMYREVAQNIEDGFGHETEKSQEANDNADSCDSYADELEGIVVLELTNYHADHCTAETGTFAEHDIDQCGEADQLTEDWRSEIRENVAAVTCDL